MIFLQIRLLKSLFFLSMMRLVMLLDEEEYSNTNPGLVTETGAEEQSNYQVPTNEDDTSLSDSPTDYEINQPSSSTQNQGQGQCQKFSNVYDQEDYVFQLDLDATEFKNTPGSGWNERCSTEVGIYKEISTNSLVCFGAADIESPNLEQEDKLYRCTDSTVGPVESIPKDTTRVPMSTLVDTLSTKKDTREVPSSPPVVPTERPRPIETTTTHTTEATAATLITATTTKAARTTEAIHTPKVPMSTTAVSVTPPPRIIRVDTKLTEIELSPKINDKIPEPIQRTPVPRVMPPPVSMQPRVNIDKVPEEVQNYPAVNPDYPDLPEPDVSEEEPSVVTPDYPYPAPELGDAEKEPTDEYPAGYPDAVDDDIVDKDPTHDEPEYALAPAPGDVENAPTLISPDYKKDEEKANELLGLTDY